MKPLIYIIDNETDYLKLVEYVFVQFLPAYSIVQFTSGEAMLSHLEVSQVQPALLLLDLHMPGMSGQQTLIRLKARQDWKHIPVVMVTSETAQGEIQSCYEAGANSCLAKPMGIEAMQTLFKRVCTYWVDPEEALTPQRN